VGGRAARLPERQAPASPTLAAFCQSVDTNCWGTILRGQLPTGGGRPVVRLGLPRLKLGVMPPPRWVIAVQGLAIDVDGLEKNQFPRDASRNGPLPAGGAFTSWTRPCRRPGHPPPVRNGCQWRRCSQYLSGFLLAPMGFASAYLAQASSLLGQIGVYAVSRDADSMRCGEAERLELHFSQKGKGIRFT